MIREFFSKQLSQTVISRLQDCRIMSIHNYLLMHVLSNCTLDYSEMQSYQKGKANSQWLQRTL